MREQFPFLRKENCPSILKELVSDLITAYYNYAEAHPKLFENLTKPEEAALSEIITTNYVLNKLAWKELEYYQANGTFLGKHPIFEKRKFEEAMRQEDSLGLNKKLNSLTVNIHRNKKKAESAKTQAEREAATAKYKKYEAQKELVTEILKNR